MEKELHLKEENREFHKIDVNTEREIVDEKTGDNRFAQAAIPTVLAGMYRYVQTDEGAKEILQADNNTAWADKIFGTDKFDVIQAIKDFSGDAENNIETEINNIAGETVKLVKENMPDDADSKAVKLFFGGQKNNILLYLPPVLKMGALLHDNTLDDATNKMEGPISSLMKNIGGVFSNPVSEEELRKD